MVKLPLNFFVLLFRYCWQFWQSFWNFIVKNNLYRCDVYCSTTADDAFFEICIKLYVPRQQSHEFAQKNWYDMPLTTTSATLAIYRFHNRVTEQLWHYHLFASSLQSSLRWIFMPLKLRNICHQAHFSHKTFRSMPVINTSKLKIWSAFHFTPCALVNIAHWSDTCDVTPVDN